MKPLRRVVESWTEQAGSKIKKQGRTVEFHFLYRRHLRLECDHVVTEAIHRPFRRRIRCGDCLQ
jgi:hypothetical protein